MFIKNNPNGVSLRIIGGEAPENLNPSLAALIGALDPTQQLSAMLQDTQLFLGEGRGEAIEHPNHYRKGSGLEAIDAIEAWDLNFNLGNVVKYVCRAGIKHNADKHEDLQKALWYLKRELGLPED